MKTLLKSFTLYRKSPPHLGTPSAWQDAITRHAHQKPGALDAVSRGWAPVTSAGEYIYRQPGILLLAYRTDKKTIPGTALREAVATACAAHEVQQGFRPGRTQAREIKERVFTEMLPHIVPTTRVNRALIWHELIAIEGTHGQAEDVLGHLHKSFPNFQCKRLRTVLSPRSAMTDWLLKGAPDGFTVDRDCVLTSMLEDKATVRFQCSPLDTAEIRSHIEAGKLCVSLAMTWQDKVSFILTEDFQLKRLVVLDLIRDQADQTDNVADEFAADFALQKGLLGQLIGDLVEEMGGEVEEGQ